MDYLMRHGGNLRNQHHIHATNIEAIALASVVCDDSVEPVQPDDASRVLYRKEVLRLTDAEVREKYPGYGGLDCNMDMSQKVMPHPPELSPDSLAESIKVQQDELDLVLLQLQTEENHIEWILLNPEGEEFKSPEPAFAFSTDAKALYLDVRDGKVSRVLAIDAAFLSVNDRDLLKRDERTDFEH